MKKRAILVLLVLGLLLFTYGCKKEDKQVVEVKEEAPKIDATPENIKIVDEKAENILIGLNRGDYALFSTDLSGNAKQSFDEEYFTKLRKFVKDNSGDYVSKAIAMSNGNSFTYDCQFSKESVLLGLMMSSDLSKVESLYFDSEKMREVLSHQLDFAK